MPRPILHLLCLSVVAVANFAMPPAIAKADPSLPIESGKVLRQLNLSDSQLLAMRNVRQKYGQEIELLRQRLKQQRQELEVMLSSNATAEQLRAKYQQTNSLRQQISQLRFERALAMRSILTPDQRAKLAEILQSRRRGRPKL